MRTGLTLILLAVALAPLARAQEKAPSEEKVRKLLELTGAAELGDQMMAGMLERFQAMPGMDPAFLKRFRERARPASLIELIIPIYQRHLDEKTVDAAIAFYDSPEGRALTKVQPQIMQEAMAAGAVWGRKLAQEVMEEMRDPAGAAARRCKEYYDMAKVWQMMNKKDPESLQDLEAPVEGAPFARIETDPWGNKYFLEREERKLRVVSAGPDGEPGTDDDIRYPTAEK